MFVLLVGIKANAAWVWDTNLIPNYAVDRDWAKGQGFWENSIQKPIYDDNRASDGATLASIGLCAAFPIGTLAGNYALGPCFAVSLSGVDSLVTGVLGSGTVAAAIPAGVIPNFLVTLSNYTSLYVGPEYYVIRNSVNDTVKPWGAVYGLVLKYPLTWSDVHSGTSSGPQL